MTKKLTILTVVTTLILSVTLSVCAQDPYPPPERDPPIDIVMAPNMLVEAGEIEVPIKFHGVEINAIVFEMYYDNGLKYIETTRMLEKPFKGECYDTGHSLQCVVYGYAIDNEGNAIAIPDNVTLFLVKFHASATSNLIFDMCSFGTIYGQSAYCNTRDGYIDVIPPDDASVKDQFTLFLSVISNWLNNR